MNMLKRKIFIKTFCISAISLFVGVMQAKAINLTPDSANGIFEEQNNIEYTVTYDTAQTSGYLSCTVTDYFGSKTYKNIKCASDSNLSQSISLGVLDTGWYKLTVKKSSSTIYSGMFAVVPALSERYKGETPFATDMAANHILRDTKLSVDYANAAKLAGLNMIRERYSWWTKNADGEYDYSRFEPIISEQSKAGMDIVALSTDYASGGYSSQTEMFCDDLFKVYNYQKEMSSAFGDKVDIWEIWNETDHDNFGDIPADIYSPFFKASAIAVKDSLSGSGAMFGGLCMYTDATEFASLMMKNDVMRYSEAYNVHRHLPVYSSETQKFDTDFIEQHETLMQSTSYNRPMWVTEAGLALSYESETNRRKQARYAVTSAVESIANGTDKHFWFILPKFKDGSSHEYGVFDENHLPYQAYASLAVATDILGKGEYKGKYNSSAFNGYVFNNGENDVLVAWSNSTQQLNIAQSYTVYDFMGREKSSATTVGADPIYIVFSQPLSASLYTQYTKVKETKPTELGVNDRIVIQTDFNEKEALTEVRKNGYLIGNTETRNVSVKIYNFNNIPVTGILNCTADGYKVTGDGVEITIPQMEYKTVSVKLTPDSEGGKHTDYISFTMTTEYGDVSPTTAKVTVTDSVTINPQTATVKGSGKTDFYIDDKGLNFKNELITVDLSKPASNPSGLDISNGRVTFLKKNQSVEYEIEAQKSGSYYISFRRENIDAGNFFIEVLVNGETVNRRTGRKTNDDGSFTFQDEVWLDKGTNIVKISNMSANDGILSSLSFARLSVRQDTTSMNTYVGGRTFKSAYKEGVGSDPWVWINDAVTSYPDGEKAPYVTFEVNIPKPGYYYPAAATAGADKVQLKVNGKSFYLNDNCIVLSEQFISSGSGVCSWLKSNEAIYLNKGSYDVTLQLYSPTDTAKWNTYLGAVRFIEDMSYHNEVAVDLSKPSSNPDGLDITNGTVTFEKNGQYVEYEISVSEAGSYYINFNRSDNFYIYVLVNGETVNRRTGRATNADGSFTFQDEIWLNEGDNTVRIGSMSSKSGTLSSLTITKLSTRQYTTSMNTHIGSRIFKEVYKPDITPDPWVWINDALEDYPDGEKAPYVTFEVNIPKSGYYYPAVATAGADKISLIVAGEAFDLNDNGVILEEKYTASGVSGAKCSWVRSNEAVYLNEGIYDVTLKAYAPAGTEKWNTFIGAVRFFEYQRPEAETENNAGAAWVEYEIDADCTGAYSVSIASGGDSNIRMIVNGSHISYKTGRTKGEAYSEEGYSSWYEYENLVPLYSGKNTVRLELMTKNGDYSDLWNAVVSEILFVKISDTPQAGITARGMQNIETNVENLATAPWAWINTPQEETPYIKWKFEVADTGYYKVRLAYGGSSKPMLKIADYTVSFEGASKTGDYCLTSTDIKKQAPWYEASDEIYLEKGIYDVEMELIDGYYSSSGNWLIGFAGFRLVQTQRVMPQVKASAKKDGNYIIVDCKASAATEFDIITSKTALQENTNTFETFITPVLVPKERTIRKIAVNGTDNSVFGVYIWDSISGMKPLIDKITLQ